MNILLAPALLGLLSLTPAPTPPSCTELSATQTAVIHELVRAVGGGVPADLGAFVARSWAGADSAVVRDRAVSQLGIEWWKSRGWTLEGSACAVGPRETYALVHNTLSDETDSLVVRFAEDGRVTGIAVGTGVRVRVRAPDTITTGARLAALRRYLARLREAGVFSGVVAIQQGPRLLFVDSAGAADRSSGASINRDTRFNLASMNKIFTATSILQLVVARKLSLDDSLGHFYPDSVLPPPVRGVRIRQLLAHRSGIRGDRDSLASAPGAEFSYSNLGFVILGEIVEQVSGERYEDYLAEHIFRPASMRWTGRYVLSKPVSYLVVGYVPGFGAQGVVLAPNDLLNTIPGNPAGGLFSNASDLIHFATALRSGKLLPGNWVDSMRTTKERPGDLQYGWGVMLWRGPGIWGHAGDLPGTDADLEILESRGIVSVVLSNFSGVNNPIRRRIEYLWGLVGH